MSDLAVQTNPIHEEVKQYIFRNYWENQISESQMAMALKLCQEYNLSPLKREIHFLPFWNSQLRKNDLQPVISYSEYIKKAQATGNLNWYKYDIGRWENNAPISCTVTIYRKDWDHPLEHTVWFDEVAQKNKDWILNNNWKTKPAFMIMKVAISQWMRLAFPEEVGGMPYEESEAWNLVNKEEKTDPIKEQRQSVKHNRKWIYWDDAWPAGQLLIDYVLCKYGTTFDQLSQQQLWELTNTLYAFNWDRDVCTMTLNSFIEDNKIIEWETDDLMQELFEESERIRERDNNK